MFYFQLFASLLYFSVLLPDETMKMVYSLPFSGSHVLAQGCTLKAKQCKEVLAHKLFTANLFRKKFN